MIIAFTFVTFFLADNNDAGVQTVTLDPRDMKVQHQRPRQNALIHLMQWKTEKDVFFIFVAPKWKLFSMMTDNRYLNTVIFQIFLLQLSIYIGNE